METDRKCLECSELLHGRSDQKFCSDQCRNAFNNRQSSETNNHIRNVNRTLKKNYAILTSLNITGKTTVYREELVKRDFNFGYFTGMTKTKKGRVVYFCYDQGYSPGAGDKVLLFRKQLQSRKKEQKEMSVR